MMLRPALRPPLRAPMRGPLTLDKGGGDIITSIFADGTDGFYFDFSKTDRLFQDLIGTPADGAGENIYVGLESHSWGGLTYAQELAAQPELIANPGPFANTTGITAVGSTLGVAGGILTITASASASGRAEWALAGLTVGRVYAVTVRARRSVGTGQRIQSWTWATVPTTALTDSFANYTFNLSATATSGVLRLYASAVGVSNDAMEVEAVSVKLIPGNHGLQATTAAQPKWQTGGRARFDGSDDNLLTTLAPASAFTFMFKLKLPTTGASTKIISGCRSTADTRAYLSLNNDGTLSAGLGTQTSLTIKGSVDRNAATGVAAFAFDGTRCELLWNAVREYEGAQSGGVQTTVPIALGAWNDNGVVGTFSNPDIYYGLAIKKRLTQAEISAITNLWGTS